MRVLRAPIKIVQVVLLSIYVFTSIVYKPFSIPTPTIQEIKYLYILTHILPISIFSHTCMRERRESVCNTFFDTYALECVCTGYVLLSCQNHILELPSQFQTIQPTIQSRENYIHGKYHTRERELQIHIYALLNHIIYEKLSSQILYFEKVQILIQLDIGMAFSLQNQSIKDDIRIVLYYLF